MKFQSLVNFPNKINKIIKMFLFFWFFTCFPHILFLTGLHFLQKGLMLHYVHTLTMLKQVNFGKHIWINMSKMRKDHTYCKLSSRDEVFTRLFVLLTGVSSSRDQILSRRKRVNSKRHFTIDRDDFIPGRVSSQDELSCINTL